MRKNTLPAAILAVLFFIIYLFHMPPSFVFGDSPELALASKTLGIAHAPGYPLYSLITHFFAYFVPVSDYALKCNIFSAFVSSLSIFLLYLLLVNLKAGYIPPFFSALFFGFSELFFKQAIISEVYSLNTLFFILFLYFLVKYELSRDARFLILTAFLLGLGFGNHHTILSAIFVFSLFYLFFNRNYRLILPFFLCFLLGVSVYLYLPIRAVADPPINFGDPKTLTNFWQVITRWQFGFGGKHYSFASFLNQSQDFLYFFNRQFYPALLVLLLMGLYLVFKENRRLFVVLFGIFLINGIITMYVLNPDENEFFLVHEFLTPSLLVSACFFCFGIDRLSKKPFVGSILLFLLLVLTAYKYYDQKPYLSQSDNIFAKKLAKDTLIVLPEKAVIIGESDYTMFPLLYLQQVEGLRKDVVVLDADFFMLPWYQEQNIKRLPFLKGLLPDIMEHSGGKAFSGIDFAALESFKLNQAFLLAKNIEDKLKSEVYFTYDFAEMARLYRPDIAARIAPFGVVYKVFISEQPKDSLPPFDVTPFFKTANLAQEEAILLTPYLPYLYREVEKTYLQNDFEKSARLFENIYLISPTIYNAANLVIMLAEEGKKLDKAQEVIDSVVANLSVPDPKVYLAKGVLDLKKGNVNDAIKILSGIETNYPQICEASFFLVEAYLKAGDREKSKLSFEKVLQGCNDYYKQRAGAVFNKR